MPLSIFSRPQATPALPWPPAPSCSLGKRYGGSVRPWWGERGGRWAWGTQSTPVLSGGATADALFPARPFWGLRSLQDP